MSLIVCDPREAEQMIARRQELGLDGHDEVWEGVYMMSPLADDTHHDIVGGFNSVLQIVIAWPGLGNVRPGVNLSDQVQDWTKNYRVPDVVVFLLDNPARNCFTHWVGGPDFGIEVVSEGDRSRQKLVFYAKVGTRELLIVDRYPWALELYALKRKKLRLVGRSTLDDPVWLKSKVVPLAFRLVAGEARPIIEVTQPGRDEPWLV